MAALAAGFAPARLVVCSALVATDFLAARFVGEGVAFLVGRLVAVFFVGGSCDAAFLVVREAFFVTVFLVAREAFFAVALLLPEAFDFGWATALGMSTSTGSWRVS